MKKDLTFAQAKEELKQLGRIGEIIPHKMDRDKDPDSKLQYRMHFDLLMKWFPYLLMPISFNAQYLGSTSVFKAENTHLQFDLEQFKKVFPNVDLRIVKGADHFTASFNSQ